MLHHVTDFVTFQPPNVTNYVTFYKANVTKNVTNVTDYCRKCNIAFEVLCGL